MESYEMLTEYENERRKDLAYYFKQFMSDELTDRQIENYYAIKGYFCMQEYYKTSQERYLLKAHKSFQNCIRDARRPKC